MAAYILYAGTTAQRLRAARTVCKVEIEVVDSSSMGYLVSGRMVRGWIAQSGIKTKGTAVDKVPLTQIEEMIARNGFVERVDAYVSYDGVLHVDISQRRPLVRLLVNGVDSYVTAEGYVFAAPRASSLYVPVVTGSYRPPFPAAYEGPPCGRISTPSRRRWTNGSRSWSGRSTPFTDANCRTTATCRRCAVCGSRNSGGGWKASAEFDKRVGELRRHKVEMRRKYRYEARMIQQGIDRIARQQEAERLKQKKLEKSYEDFMKLLTFVEFVEEDDFWRSEVVQIAARTTPQRSVGGGAGAARADATPFFSGASSRWSVSSTSCCASTATGCRTSAGMRTGR